MPSGTPIPARTATCPANSGADVITDAGIVYALGCGNDTTNGSLQAVGSRDGFNGCFALCDNAVALYGAFCSSFTFVGGNDAGTGGGTCYLKREGSQDESPGFTQGRSGLVGAYRRSPKNVMTISPSAMSRSTSMSVPSGSASMTGSSSLTVSASSSSVSSSTSPTATVSCGGQYVTSDGVLYNTYCNSDASSGNFATETIANGDFTACAPGCASRPNCQAFVFGPFPNGIGGVCYYKNAPGNLVTKAGFVAGVRDNGPSSTSSSMQRTSSSMTSSASGNNQMTMTTSSSSSSGSPTSTTIPMALADAQCPRDDRAYVTDYYGIVYQIGCSSDTTGGSISRKPAPDGFKDCFALCDDSYATSGDVCTSFAYTGGTNGVGGGDCYFKGLTSAQNGFTPSNAGHVAGLRISPNDVVTPTPGTSSSTSYSTSSGNGGALTSSSVGTSIPSSRGTTSSAVPSSSSMAMGGTTSSNRMTGMSSSSSYSSMMNGTSSSSSVRSMSSSSSLAGTSSISSSRGDSSSSTRGSSTSTPAAYEPSPSINTMTSSSMGGMSSMTTSSMSPDTPKSSSSMGMGMSSSSMEVGMTSSSAAPSPSLPDEASFFSSYYTMTSSMMTTAPAYESSSSEFVASTPTDEPSMPVNPSGSPVFTDATSTSDDMPVSSTTSLEACPTQTDDLNPGDGGSCSDPYGNPFNVTYGTVYTGRITVRAVRPNVASCLILCDETPGCEAVNYVGSECQVLTEVTGNYTAPGVNAVAATRAPDATTTYTVPPTSMSSTMPATSAPVSNGSPSTTTGGAGGVSTPASQGGSNPGYTAGVSTPAVTGGASTPSNAASTSNAGQGSSASGGVGQSTPGAGGNTSQGPGSYMSTNAQQSTPTMMPTMTNPSFSMGGGQGSSVPGGQSSVNGGPGPVDASNSGIVPGGTSTRMSMSDTYGGGRSMTNGGSGAAPSSTSTATFSNNGNQNNGGTIRPTSSASPPPASTGAVCPYYDNAQYTDTRGSSYTVDCNGTYIGNVILSTNSTTTPGRAKRQAPGGLTASQCMVLCDTTTGCIAINMNCAGTCSLLSSVTSTVDGTCGVAARRISGGSGGSGGDSGVSTITICAARTGTTTVFTTATLTTCAATGECPAGSGRMGKMGML